MTVVKYDIPKNNGENTVVSNSSGGTSITATLESHNLWGQPFDGTADVSGDLKNVGNVDAKGNVTITGSSEDGLGNLSVQNNITADSANISELASTQLSSDTATINSLSSTSMTAEQLRVLEDAIMKNIAGKNITTEYLTVTKTAHFFELIIDKIKAVGGSIILSNTNSKIDKVEELESGYRCLFKKTDGAGEITNDWVAGDYAICQTFNTTQSKYYWRLVANTGTDGEYHYIDLSDTLKDGSSIPTAGDNIVQLGNRVDKNRQNAIILSAYKSIDSSVEAPSIVQYRGIKDFDISKYKWNVTAANGNIFRGNFRVESGASIEEEINSKIADNKPQIIDNYWYINGENTGVKAKGSGYRVEAFQTSGSSFFTDGQTNWKATFSIHVWYDEEEITDTLPSTRFIWSRESEDKARDAIWNSTHSNSGSTIQLTYDDLVGDTNFICKFMDNNNTTIKRIIL